jgi:N-acetylmuramoyl-L-alanine amidase CwlA
MLTPYNFTDKNSEDRVEYIVIHYYGSLGTAKAVAKYFASAYRGASAHFNLDDSPIVWQSVDVCDIAWHCGTKGTYYHRYCRNSNSIGIEVRPYKIDTSRAEYASDKDWYFTAETIDNLVEFVKYLMEKYNVPIERVVRHYDVTHKQCPRPFQGSDTNEYYGIPGDEMWERFLARLQEDDEETSSNEEDDDVVRYNKLSDIPNGWDAHGNPRATIEMLMNAGIVGGDGSDTTGNDDVIDLSHDMVRMMIFEFRGKLYDEECRAAGYEPDDVRD